MTEYYEGDTFEEIKNIKEVEEKVLNLYTQKWHEYNEATTKEKLIAQQLLLELLQNIEEPKYSFGRPGTPIKERIFCMFLYSYSTFSSRRSISDLEIARRRNLLSKTYHFNTLMTFYNDKGMTPLISQLIEITALPLRMFEKDFTMDSSGFSCPRFSQWFNIRTQKKSLKRDWKKANLFCGVKSNIIVSLTITDGNDGDSPELIPLIKRASKFFDMEEVSADKAYSSRENLKAIAKIGAIPFIPFRSNSTIHPKGYRIWKTMWMFYYQNQEKFLEHYHKRSNAESTFSMIKRKFGNHLRTKRDTSQVNEILMKCLCHNLSVLIHESFELGIEIDFTSCAKLYFAHKEN